MDKTRMGITRIARVARRYASGALKDSGLGIAEYDCLHAIRKNEGTNQEYISEILNVDKAAVTRMISNLEKKGYVVREKDLDDKRKNNIYSTDKAMEIKFEAIGAESLFYEWLLDDIDLEKAKVFLEVLEELTEKARNEIIKNFVNVKSHVSQDINSFQDEIDQYHRMRRDIEYRRKHIYPSDKE